MQVTARDLTGEDLSSHMGNRISSKSGLAIGFFWGQVRVKSVDPSKNKTESRLFVAKQIKGDPRTISHQPITKEQAAREFPREWAFFEEFEDVPEFGTPLKELPGVSQSQIGQLMAHGLKCIEDLENISNEQAMEASRDIAHARNVALKWLEKRDSNSDVLMNAENATNAEVALKAMQERLNRLEAANLKLQSENTALRTVGGGGGNQAAPNNNVIQDAAESSASEAPYDLDDGDDFMSGGEIATGVDDLGGEDPDPLAD